MTPERPTAAASALELDLADPDCAAASLAPVVSRLEPVPLEVVNATAALQERVDRKYVVRLDQLAALLADMPATTAVLEIDTRRTFHYETVYFDTDDLASYHGAALGRARRFKVRTRSYLDSRRCLLEVKLRGTRERTVKHAIAHPFDERTRLDASALAFVDSLVERRGRALAPALTTTYERCTLVDLDSGSRITCDTDLTFVAGPTVRRLESHVVVETKSSGAPTEADRLLWSIGRRPEPMSKYGVGLATVTPGLRANKWHRTIRRYFA